MNRYELDSLATHYRLKGENVETLLQITHARPTRAEMLQFALRLLQLASVLSIGAGIVFFIAANWDIVGIFGRFILIEALLCASVGIALFKPPPQAVGKYALLLAFVLVGTLLALFGQTYQTGADTYELFLGWTFLSLVFVLAAGWSVLWAAWLLVLNVALWLYCGWQPQSGWFWVLLGVWTSPSLLALLAMGVNLLALAAIEYARTTRYASLAPQWLARFALACAITFATWSGCLAIVDSFHGSGPDIRAWSLLVIATTYAGIALYCLRQRRDVFPLALVAGSTILIGTVWLSDALGYETINTLLILALWLIASSTVCAHLLMRLIRAWRTEARA